MSSERGYRGDRQTEPSPQPLQADTPLYGAGGDNRELLPWPSLWVLGHRKSCCCGQVVRDRNHRSHPQLGHLKSLLGESVVGSAARAPTSQAKGTELWIPVQM